MDQASVVLRDALLAAFARHASDRVAARRWPPVTEAIREGEDWLRAALEDLLGRPYSSQPRTPLELFQEALAPANAALAEAGVAPPVRDPMAVAALPGDVYDLAPASSADLGEDTWRAHLVWGSAKARALTRPTVGLLAANLADRDRIERVVNARGLGLQSIHTPDRVTGNVVVLVDLTDPAAEATITAAAGAGIRTIAFGPHVDEFAMVRARSLGATAALPRSQFFRDLERWLPEFA